MSEQKLTGYPSIDKPWLKYFTKAALAMEPPESSVFRNLYENNKDYPDNTAILYYSNQITYEKMFDCVEACAKSLKQIGIRVGDCINLCTAAVPEAIFLVLACSKIGVIANFVNPLFTTEQMIDRINDTESEWLFVLDEMYSYIEKALPETCVKNVVLIPVYHSMPNPTRTFAKLKSKTKEILRLSTTYRLIPWNDFQKIGEFCAVETEVPYRKDTPVIMVYSSGSTGASKGILLTNESVNSVIATYCRSDFNFQRGDSFLQMVPIWFSTGIVLSILMPLFFGMFVIPELKFSMESFAVDLEKHQPSMTLTSTSVWLYVMNTYQSKTIDFSKMKYPISGGEKLLPQDERLLNEYLHEHGFKRKLYKGYGMCELGSEATGTTDSPIYVDKPGGSGYPMLGVSVAAFDIETNKELKYGEHGEIRVCTPAHMKGYYKNQAATDAFFHMDENGQVWGCTGDIGYVDEDGEVFILGRATDSAILDSGKKVYLFDVENVILQEEHLSGCKVVAIEEDGKTILVAHMTVRDGFEYDCESFAHKIHEACKKQLPDEEVPLKYKFRDSFPVHINAKRDNNALKKETEGFVTIPKD